MSVMLAVASVLAGCSVSGQLRSDGGAPSDDADVALLGPSVPAAGERPPALMRPAPLPSGGWVDAVPSPFRLVSESLALSSAALELLTSAAEAELSGDADAAGSFRSDAARLLEGLGGFAASMALLGGPSAAEAEGLPLTSEAAALAGVLDLSGGLPEAWSRLEVLLGQVSSGGVPSGVRELHGSDGVFEQVYEAYLLAALLVAVLSAPSPG